MKVALAQLNPVVGDVAGNVLKMEQALGAIPPGTVDLIIYPELMITGYPPRDLLTHSWFLKRVEEGVNAAVEMTRTRPDLGFVFGTPRPNGAEYGKHLTNAALLVEDGNILYEQHKLLLPTYDVFDELRYFHPGDPETYRTVAYKGERLGISICEDAWNDEEFEGERKYAVNPIEILSKDGATLLINIAASPYHRNKDLRRFQRSAHHAKKWNLPYVAVGQVGANDELIFDGRSVVVDNKGGLVSALDAFNEDVRVVDSSSEGTLEYPQVPVIESIRQALVLGVRDYMRKCGFQRVVLGLSGGIDSALTACIAVDAIGAENVHGVTMPSHYSSSGSVGDSLELAANLGIVCDQVAIREIFDSFNTALETPFKGLEPDVTEENLQARIRGTLLMAYSNKFNALLLTTGNKSELAVGYCTLYGDMDGGLAVISDLPKTVVYDLARWYNRDGDVIPDAILTKPPSAELRPGQTDQDSLPDYETLDPILVAYLEEGKSPHEIIELGYDAETVHHVIRLVDISEYKRWQAAPGLRVSPKSFGAGRRMPIAAKKH